MAPISAYLIACCFFCSLLPLATCQTPATTVTVTEAATTRFATTTQTVAPPGTTSEGAGAAAGNACVNVTGACVVYNDVAGQDSSYHATTETMSSSGSGGSGNEAVQSTPENSDGYIAAGNGNSNPGDGYIGEGASTNIGIAVIGFVLVNVCFCVLL